MNAFVCLMQLDFCQGSCAKNQVSEKRKFYYVFKEVLSLNELTVTQG